MVILPDQLHPDVLLCSSWPGIFINICSVLFKAGWDVLYDWQLFLSLRYDLGSVFNTPNWAAKCPDMKILSVNENN